MVTHTTENNNSAQNVTTNTGPVFISPLHKNKSDINDIKAKDNKKYRIHADLFVVGMV